MFDQSTLKDLFPSDRADDFFEALLGAASEGAYDINLIFKEKGDNHLDFEFHLEQRPGKCLACNLTYGLPQVFARHPVIDIEGIVAKIDDKLNGTERCADWKLGATREITKALHIIPLTIYLK
jgi:hypothetical protein